MTRLSLRGLALWAALTHALLCAAQNTAPAGHLTDALDGALWDKSEWISARDAPVVRGAVGGANERAADGASWFAASVRNKGRVTQALWMTAGLGVYELYVNGRPVGREALKPGYTSCFRTKRSFTYDITRALNAEEGAENTLSAEVTPGWWADKIITPGGNDGMYGTKCAFRGVLRLTYDDGSAQTLGTNTADWRAGVAGPVTHAAIFDGEEYDARVPLGCDTPEKLAAPERNTEFKGEILPTGGAEIYHRDDLALRPRRAYLWKGVSGASDSDHGTVNILREFKDGEEMVLREGETLVVDFGQNCAAVPDFLFCAAEGVRLTCLPAELLNDGNGAKSRGMDGPEGSCHRLNLRVPDIGMRLTYTFGPEAGYAAYRPRHTFFGYRYASLTATGEVRIKRLLSVPVSSIAQSMETGVITTGNELVNKLISNTLWGQRSNYLSVPTDCPQRNERLGWTADTQVFAETGTFFANTADFFRKWTRDLRDSMSPQGGYPSVAPFGQYGNETMRLGWADAGIIVPWTVWKQFADRDIVEENWEAMDRYMAHVNSTKYDHDALRAENGDFQYADWLSYEALESTTGTINDEQGRRRSETLVWWNYLSASYWAMDADMMADMARGTGRDAAKYERMARDARDYLRRNFLNGDGTFRAATLNTMQTPALFAMRNKLVEGAALENMKARLRQNFRDHGGCLQTGFLGTSILMGTLTENGMADVAYDLLLQRKNPSWLYSVDNGATTIWERWNSYMLDKGMGPRGMNSFNHYAYGCVCEWLWKTAAGIAADPAQPGFRHIIMRPVPDPRLGSVKASYPSASGLITSEWRYKGTRWVWKFDVPQGATASVTLPGETRSTEYGPGTHTIKRDLDRP